MNKRYIYYCLLLAFLATGLYNLFLPNNSFQAEQHWRVGHITDKDVIAPYDFPLLKPKQQYNQEKAQILKSIKPAYRLSDEVQFNLIKAVNESFVPLLEYKGVPDTADIAVWFKKEGIPLTSFALQQLQNRNTSRAVYAVLSSEPDQFYNRGIYSELRSDTINVFQNGKITLQTRESLLSVNQVKGQMLTRAVGGNQKEVLNEILSSLIKPNLIYDKKLNDDLVQQTINRMSSSIGMISKNEIVVRSNTRLTEDDINKIRSMLAAARESRETHSTWRALWINLGLFLYYLFLGLILMALYKLFFNSQERQKYNFFPLVAGMALNILLIILNNHILNLHTLMLPYSLTTVAAAILLGVPFALVYNIVTYAVILPFVDWEMFPAFSLFLGCAAVVLLMSRMREKHGYFSIWAYLCLFSVFFSILFAIYNLDPFSLVLGNIVSNIISAVITVFLLIIIVPYLEKKWNLATRQGLLQLLDFNHPLLKKLATSAPGTYYHSLVVGNLAERAAESIGANSLLARVGSYYHDIGKIQKPELFTENNPDSSAIHEKLEPTESAYEIKHHVEDGIELAHKYNLPPVITDIILQHHGTGYIRYFLDKAEKGNLPIDLDEFRYEGPKPQSREAAVVMIADIVESIAKSWDEVDREDIRKILNDTIMRLIREGQFDETSISLQDLLKVKESMIPILESIYRKRQQYPEAERDGEF